MLCDTFFFGHQVGLFFSKNEIKERYNTGDIKGKYKKYLCSRCE